MASKDVGDEPSATHEPTGSLRLLVCADCGEIHARPHHLRYHVPWPAFSLVSQASPSRLPTFGLGKRSFP